MLRNHKKRKLEENDEDVDFQKVPSVSELVKLRAVDLHKKLEFFNLKVSGTKYVVSI